MGEDAEPLGCAGGQAAGLVQPDRALPRDQRRITTFAQQRQYRDDHGHLGPDADPGGVRCVRTCGGLPGEQQFAGQIGADLIKRARIPQLPATASVATGLTAFAAAITAVAVAFIVAGAGVVADGVGLLGEAVPDRGGDRGGHIEVQFGHAVVPGADPHTPAVPGRLMAFFEGHLADPGGDALGEGRQPARGDRLGTFQDELFVAGAAVIVLDQAALAGDHPHMTGLDASRLQGGQGGREGVHDQIGLGDPAGHGGFGHPTGHRQLRQHRPVRPLPPPGAGIGRQVRLDILGQGGQFAAFQRLQARHLPPKLHHPLHPIHRRHARGWVERRHAPAHPPCTPPAGPAPASVPAPAPAPASGGTPSPSSSSSASRIAISTSNWACQASSLKPGSSATVSGVVVNCSGLIPNRARAAASTVISNSGPPGAARRSRRQMSDP